MSTISKIDPNVRAARSRRRDVTREVQYQALMHRGSLLGDAYAAFAHRLNKVRRDPRLTGAAKEASFKALWQNFAAT